MSTQNARRLAALRFALRYARCALAALAAVGFGINLPGGTSLGSTPLWGITFN